MGRRRWAGPAAVLALLLAAAVGCGAGNRRPAPGAHIAVGLNPDGSGQVDFWAGAGLHSDAALRDLGGRVAGALFPGRPVKPTIVLPSSAFPLARTEIPRAYERGPRPVFRVAGDKVGAVLRTAGYPGYTLQVRFPQVRTSVGARSRPPGVEYAWKVAPGGAGPDAVIVMRPRYLHWAVEMALLAVAVMGAATAFASRIPWIAIAGCAAVLVAAVTVLVSDRSSGDCLGVFGDLSGAPLALVTSAPLLALPLAVLAGIRVAYLRPYSRRRQRPFDAS
jgi:hypothetical protein